LLKIKGGVGIKKECPECGTELKSDAQHYELVCPKCGLVQKCFNHKGNGLASSSFE